VNSQLIAFTTVALMLTLTPGADTMLVIRSTLARGSRAGIATAVGIGAGLFVHATASALGLSLFLTRSAAAFQAVKALGALYLVYLGGRSFFNAWTGRGGAFSAIEGDTDDLVAAKERATSLGFAAHRRAFANGFLCNVLNPKAAIFYLAFLPQFISPGQPVLATSILLASIHFALGIVWLSVVSLGLGRIRPLLTRGSVRRGLEATTGAVLVAFGMRLALDRG